MKILCILKAIERIYTSSPIFKAIDGKENPSCSKYLASVMIWAILGSKFTIYTVSSGFPVTNLHKHTYKFQLFWVSYKFYHGIKVFQ